MAPPLNEPPYCVCMLESSSPVKIASKSAILTLAISTPFSASVSANSLALYSRLLLYFSKSLCNCLILDCENISTLKFLAITKPPVGISYKSQTANC